MAVGHRPGAAAERSEPRYEHLEVLDTDGGLWLLDLDGTIPTATPTTATDLWRLLVRATVADEPVSTR